MPLTLFSSAIGPYSAAELNDALYTVFGEISANLHDKLKEEAEAVASTIFNRHQLIIDTRKTYAEAQTKLADAKKERDDAIVAHDELGNKPAAAKEKLRASGVKKDQIETEYAKLLQAAKDRYRTATGALAAAQNANTQAVSAKIAAEAYVAPSARKAASITLTDVVTAPGPDNTQQYEGYAPGKKLYLGYATFSAPDKERQEKRWTTARNALESLGRDPKKRQKYIEFRSSNGGKRKLKATETRIGGNDFW